MRSLGLSLGTGYARPMNDEGDFDQLSKEFAEVAEKLEVAIRALREIADPQRAWPARYGGPAPAMAARSSQALRELGLLAS